MATRLLSLERTFSSGRLLAFGDKTFEVVKELVYFGLLVTLNNDVRLKIQRRIQTSN
jgi:hypothetical protein